jgi:hypothetical protein
LVNPLLRLDLNVFVKSPNPLPPAARLVLPRLRLTLPRLRPVLPLLRLTLPLLRLVLPFLRLNLRGFPKLLRTIYIYTKYYNFI